MRKPFILRLGQQSSRNIRKNFSGGGGGGQGNETNLFRVGFFVFWVLGLKLAQVTAVSITHYLFDNNIFCLDNMYQFNFSLSPYNYKRELNSFIVKKMFTEIGVFVILLSRDGFEGS